MVRLSSQSFSYLVNKFCVHPAFSIKHRRVTQLLGIQRENWTQPTSPARRPLFPHITLCPAKPSSSICKQSRPGLFSSPRMFFHLSALPPHQQTHPLITSIHWKPYSSSVKAQIHPSEKMSCYRESPRWILQHVLYPTLNCSNSVFSFECRHVVLFICYAISTYNEKCSHSRDSGNLW